MAWRDKNGDRWHGRRSNGWPLDDKAPDGYTVAGYRKIDKQGRIRFGGSYWTHEQLRENTGRIVRICWDNITARAYFGHDDATPETILEHHSSFYDYRTSILLDDCGDWNKRPVTKF